MSRTLLVGFLCGVVGWSTTTEAVAGPATTVVDPTAEQRFVIEQLTADKAMTVANERRIADAKQNQLYEQLQAKDRELRVAQKRAAGNAAELTRVRKARDKITKQRQELVAALAQRDRTLEAELRAYREAVTAVATSPDPKTQELLRRYANGEQREALVESDVLADADLAARNKAGAIANAAKRRPWAILAIQAHDNGKVTLEEVVQKFEKLTQLDPGMTEAWVFLARLYRTQGRLGESQKVAQLAYTSISGGGNERDRSVVLDELGDIAVQAGDLKDAKARYEEGLGIRRTLAKDNPTSAEAQRDFSISVEKLGDIAVQAGDLKDAKARYEEGLGIARKLAKDNPTSAVAQRDLSVSLEKLGDIAVQAGDLKDARARYEEGLGIARNLAKDNPTSAAAQRDLSISLEKLGNIAVQAGDLKDAKARYDEGLGIRRKLAKDNPTSAEAQRDLSISLNKLGDIAVQAGDLKDAKARYEEGLGIRRTLAKDNPMSAEAQRDLIVSLAKLGLATGDRKLLNEALEIARALESSGRLAPSDRGMVDGLVQAIKAMP